MQPVKRSRSRSSSAIWASRRGPHEATRCFPDARQGPAARPIEDEADVRDVIQLLRLNDDRVVSRDGLAPDTAA